MSKYKYKPEVFDKTGIEQWNRFVEESVNGCIFHRLDFLAYHGDRFLENAHHLAWYKGETLSAVMPMGIFIENGRRVARSPFGASWGGLVHEKNLKLKYAIKMTESLIDYLKGIDIDECMITPTPMCYFDTYTNYFEQTLFAQGFSLLYRDICHIVELPGKEEEVWLSFDSKCRNQVRNGLKNFKITEDGDFEEFYLVLLEDKKRHNDAVPTHTLQELKYLQEKFKKRVFVDIAVGRENVKAGICYFACNSNTLSVFYIAQQSGALGLNGVNALVLKGMQRAVREGFKYFDFGTSSYHNKSRNLNLSQFKESFGARGYFRDMYRWQNEK